jgi:hypothetical protein
MECINIQSKNSRHFFIGMIETCVISAGSWVSKFTV